MSDNGSLVVRYLGRPAYLLAAFLAITPVADFVTNVWPFQPASDAWRYASEGLFSGSLASMVLGILLALGVAIARGQRGVLAFLALMGWVCAAVFALTAVDFALNVLEVRGGAVSDAAARWTFDLGAVKVTAKYLVAATLVGWATLGAHRWRRERAGERSSRRVTAPSLFRNTVTSVANAGDSRAL